MKRNYFYYIFLGVLSALSVCSCEIEESELDEDIRYDFEHGDYNSGSGNSGSYDAPTPTPTSTLAGYDYAYGYGADITYDFVTNNQLAVELAFGSNVKEYAVLFSDEVLEPAEALKRLSAEKPTPVSEPANFSTMSYSSAQKNQKVYVYVIGFSSARAERGNLYSDYFYLQPSSTSIDNAEVNILDVGCYGGELSWKFAASSYPYEYVLLFDEEAQFADKLSDAALILFMRGRAKSVGGQEASKIKQMSAASPNGADYVFIATHVNAYGHEALTVRRFYSRI